MISPTNLLAACALALAIPAAKPTNVLVNGSFEKGFDGWLRFDTTKQGRIETVDDSHEGKQALLLQRKGGDGVVMVRQDLDARGKELNVSASFRSKTGGKAHVVVWGYEANSDKLALNSEVVSITGPVKTWTRKEAKVTVPDTVVKLSVAIRAMSDGEFLFDDVAMSVNAGDKASGKPSGPLANGGFESGLVGWQIEAPSGRTTVEANADARRSGAKGLHVERTARCEEPWDAVLAPLAEMPKGPFTARAQVRVVHATCALEVRFVDERGALVKAVEVGRTDKEGWSTLQGKVTWPRDAKSAAVALLVTGKGIIDVDDVEIR